MTGIERRIQIGGAVGCVIAALAAAGMFVAQMSDGGQSRISLGFLLVMVFAIVESYIAIRRVTDGLTHRPLWLGIVSRVTIMGAMLIFFTVLIGAR